MVEVSALPRRARVFVDTVTLLYHLGGLSRDAQDLLRRIEQREISGYTSLRVLDELLFKWMIAEASTTFGWSWKKARERMRTTPETAKALAYVYDRVAELASLFQVIEPTLSDLLNGAKEMQARYGLVGNDALTVHLIRKHRIPFLATFDTDFSVVSEVGLVAMTMDTPGRASES
jgi:predicted nucleic acid-binding protein